MTKDEKLYTYTRVGVRLPKPLPCAFTQRKWAAGHFFDGPAGTQVPMTVVDAISEYLLGCNANHGGVFQTSVQSDRWLHQAHEGFADFVGASDADEIIFGPNMTTLTFALSRSLAKAWSRSDEIIVTRLDHDANVSPWVMAAEEAGASVIKIPLLPDDFSLDLDQLYSSISERTKLVALGCASNATGGINPVKDITAAAHQVGAKVFLDAVHYGPHGMIDVTDWECDFLACSPYKFFGPHLGVLWGKKQWLKELEAYRVRPAGDKLPGKWMTGTQSHESIVGALAAVDYLTDIGESLAQNSGNSRRQSLCIAMDAIQEYEQSLSRKFLDGFSQIENLQVYGITDSQRLDERFPTFSITHPKISPSKMAEQLSDNGIYVWNGNYYALEFTESLELEPEGMVRIGLVHYNTEEEVDRCLEVLHQICA